MHRWILAAALALALAAPAAPAAVAGPDRVWGDAEGTVGDILEDRAEVDFGDGPDSAAYQRRMDALLAEAADILSTSDVRDERERLAQIRAEVKATRARIEDYRFKMASAPEERAQGFFEQIAAAVKGVVVPTKQTYRDRIREAEQDIEQLRAEATDVKADFAEGLRKIGINLSPQQVEGMLSMATADDLVDILAIFHNLKAVNERLLKATVNTDESIEVARRYYGLHTVMLEVALFAHVEFVRRVDEVYLARLSEIVEETEEVRAQSRAMLRRQRDPGLKQVVENNIEAQRLTLRAAAIYEDRLIDQRESVQAALDKLSNRVQVARNTYRTVQLSSELVAMLRSSDKAFEQIMKLDLPDLRPFESLELRQEFNRLTEEIQEPTS